MTIHRTLTNTLACTQSFEMHLVINAQSLVHREAPTHGYLLTFSGWANARRTEAELTCSVLAIVSHVAGGVCARICRATSTRSALITVGRPPTRP